MVPFFGIVIEQSLTDPAFAETLDIVQRKPGPNGSWTFLLVRISSDRLFTELERIRQALTSGQPWYAHFFSGEKIAVVFSEAIFSMTTDVASWEAAIAHGLSLGIRREQLDFWPHSVEQVEEMFGISLADLS